MNTYTAHVIDTQRQMHSIRVEATSHRTVKATARSIATAQGIQVRYVESFYLVG